MPRNGWNQAFRNMNENGDYELLIPDIYEVEEFE